MSYLASNHNDWQLKKTKFKGSTTGTLTTYQKQSKPDDCTIFSKEKLNTILLNAGNVFADSPLNLIAGPICLPPNTTLDISSTELVVPPFTRPIKAFQPKFQSESTKV